MDLSISPSACIIDMNCTEENKALNSKKPFDQHSMNGPGPSISTSASTGTTDLIPYAPASDLVATSSTQVTAGVIGLPDGSDHDRDRLDRG